MRSLLLLTLLCCACGSDPFVGTYNVTVTGTENETMPSNTTRSISGLGSVSVTQNKDRTGYVVVFGESTYQCRFTATRSTSGAGSDLDFPGGQTCNLPGFNSTTTDVKFTVDAQTLSSATLTVSYAFTYTDFLARPHAGTGTRTYTGSRL